MIFDLLKRLSLGEIGGIKIGIKGEKTISRQGKEFRKPIKLDHFIITTKARNAAGDFVIDSEMHKILGKEPRELGIRLLYDEIDLNFETSYVYYHGKKCLCRGDGRYAERRQKDGSIVEIECNYDKCEYSQPDKENNGARKCKAFGRLQCILEQTIITGGVHVYRTTSWNSIINIMSSLKFIQSITGGILAGIPLKMRIQPKTVTPEGTNLTTTVYVVNVIYAGSPQQLLEQTLDVVKRRTVAGVQLKQIQEQASKVVFKDQFEETEQEVKDITEEFYADTTIVDDNGDGKPEKEKGIEDKQEPEPEPEPKKTEPVKTDLFDEVKI